MNKLTEFEVFEIVKKYSRADMPPMAILIRRAILHAQQILEEKNRSTKRVVITETSAEIHSEAWDKMWKHFDVVMDNVGKMCDQVGRVVKW